MNEKPTTTEKYKKLIKLLEKMPLPDHITAAFHLEPATKDEINAFAREHNTVAYQRPNGNLCFNFKYTPNIDIYIWE